MSDSLPQEKRSNSHFPQLDGVRGIAILVVLIYHFMAISPLPKSAIDKTVYVIAKSGWVGVDLFFVLSGYLITGILLAAKQRERYFINFYARRFLRIFPLYYLVLFILFIIIPLCVNQLPKQLIIMKDNQLWFWTYLANWYVAYEGDFTKTAGGYFWSLAVEEQFYIIWPIIVYRLSIYKFRNLCVVLFIFSFCLRNILLFSGFTTTATYVSTITHMDGLLIGSWLSTVIRDPLYFTKIRPLLNKSAIISCLLIILIFAYQYSFYFWDLLVSGLGYSLLAILFTAIVSESIVSNGYITGFFNNGILRKLGTYSYAMYLFHVPVSRSLSSPFYKISFISNQPLIIKWCLFILTASLVTYILAFISWHSFEKHFIKIKTYFECRN